jgi:predicted AAA+ superfamily ATPase
MKSPRLYWADTGLALYPAELSQPGGAHLECLVLSDLLGWRDCRAEPAQIYHWPPTSGEEVDFVIEGCHGGALVGRLLRKPATEKPLKSYSP